MNQPDFLSLPSYESLEQIRKTFPCLATINSNHEFDNLENCKYFIIRTQGEDNVHRAMKYGIWTSSSRKNERLNDAFSKGPVYLFFTEINSMCFSGMAKITSQFDPKSHFKYWLIENKWFGVFGIQWLYVKDLSFKLFENIKQIQKLDGSEETVKSVYDLIDCTELTLENGIKMVNIFKNEQSKKSLFEDFPQLDKLESDSRVQRDGNPYFERKFKELSSIYETIPYSFSVASYERKRQNKHWQHEQYYWQNNGFYQQDYGYYQQQQRPQKFDKRRKNYNQQIEYVQKHPQQDAIVQQNI